MSPDNPIPDTPDSSYVVEPDLPVITTFEQLKQVVIDFDLLSDPTGRVIEVEFVFPFGNVVTVPVPNNPTATTTVPVGDHGRVRLLSLMRWDDTR